MKAWVWYEPFDRRMGDPPVEPIIEEIPSTTRTEAEAYMGARRMWGGLHAAGGIDRRRILKYEILDDLQAAVHDVLSPGGPHAHHDERQHPDDS